MKIAELDIVFLSYDEPNAELHYADLCNKVPWAKRIHGVKGSDAAHKAAANLSETEWVITVDADNKVYPSFFNLDIDVTNPKIQVYSWLGNNKINGLQYGNGGLKIWKKDFILNMKTHEASDSDRAQVDFCWEDGYHQFKTCFSDVVITGSPKQAWRAGFREGVKMTLLDGVKVNPADIKEQIWWHNLHRLRMWSTIGAHEDNGLFAIYGARLGTYMTNCTNWDYTQVRDFEYLESLYNYEIEKLENNQLLLVEKINELGTALKLKLGLDWVYLDAIHSKYVLDLYSETIRMNNTYYKITPDV